ncbi:MAG: hypothetical protein J6K63_01940 [Clostridia bacterium]|nr:hypothetical protein [Clostridia bacterium]
MNYYYIEDFEDREGYEKFIDHMLSYSDYFSFIYFRYRENERMKKTTREIHDALAKFKVKSKFTHEWPGTISFDDQHFYKIVLYRSDPAAKEILCRFTHLFDWDYPMAPMDMAFYKDGMCVFSVTAHERDASLYTDDKKLVHTLEAMGVDLDDVGETENVFMLSEIF